MVNQVVVGSLHGSESIPNPDWEQVEALIRSLDGHSRTDLFIGDVDSLSYIDVSGGHNGRYVVVVQQGERGYYTLIKPSKGRREIEISTGGMGRFCPREECQTLKTTLLAARTYFETGKRDSRFAWRKSP
jgi:hypothetical protein